jgi:hypothetical protein
MNNPPHPHLTNDLTCLPSSPLIVCQETFACCIHHLSGNICMLHSSTKPTAHPCTTHRTLLRQSIFTHKRSTHCARKPTHRIFQARLPPSHKHPCQLLPHSNSPHITIMLNIITPQLHSHARASPFCPLNRCARSPIGAARH